MSNVANHMDLWLGARGGIQKEHAEGMKNRCSVVESLPLKLCLIELHYMFLSFTFFSPRLWNWPPAVVPARTVGLLMRLSFTW